MILTIDCESKPQQDLIPIYLGDIKAPKTYKDKEKIAEFVKKKEDEARKGMSVDTDFAEILCIGTKKEDEAPIIHDSFQEFFDYITKLRQEQIDKFDRIEYLTFNGKGFDFPLLIKQTVKHGSNHSIIKEWKEACKKWNSPSHIDLMEVISNGGTYRSLDLYLQIYLGIAKTPIDFETASVEEIKEHNIEDLENTFALYNKFKIIL